MLMSNPTKHDELHRWCKPHPPHQYKRNNHKTALFTLCHLDGDVCQVLVDAVCTALGTGLKALEHRALICIALAHHQLALSQTQVLLGIGSRLLL